MRECAFLRTTSFLSLSATLMSDSKTFFFGFWGAGRMAGAMVRGLLASGQVPAKALACIDSGGGSGAALARETGIAYLGTASETLFLSSDWLILGAKPKHLLALAESPHASAPGATVLSVAAGVRLASLQAAFPSATNWIRLMPNTPSRVQAGVTAWCAVHPLTGPQEVKLEALLSSLGQFIEVEEDLFDAVTALSGSGPAYYFEFCRLMAEAGKSLGLSEAQAGLLARATFTGAARLAEGDNRSMEAMRNEVSSPGGTTEAALQTFAAEKLSDSVQRALTAARDRGRELSG
jgi:pyrroline-5-carboxylate reductase